MVHRNIARGLSILACVCMCLTCADRASAQSNAHQIEPPRKLKDVPPAYPDAARRAGVHGTVTVEAVVGADGTVTGAKVVTSIPLLDEAALAAVRQWVYAPAMLNGAPTAVVMTVKVNFALEPTQPRPVSGPLVLDRNEDDWTLNGTPLLDNDLRFWLRETIRTEPAKELFVHAAGTERYAELVDVLASATAAGVEQLRVFVGDAGPADSVRVWLDPVAARPAGVTLPVADVGVPPANAGGTITMSRTGAVPGAALQRAASGAVVRLRADRLRRVSDVWEVLRAGAARQVGGFALVVQLPTGATVAADAPVSPPQQREWDEFSKTVSARAVSEKKTLDEMTDEVLPALDTFVTRNPNVLDAQFLLGTFYERHASRQADPADRRKDLENAARHFERAAVHENADARFVAAFKLAQLYGVDNLNDPAHAERYARRFAAEFPTHAEAHVFYAELLRAKGDIAGAANAMRIGRAASEMPVVGQLLSVQYLVEQVQADRALSEDRARSLLEEAIAITDAILARPDKDEADYRRVTMARSMALELEAERVARSRQERLALLAESDRWNAPVDQQTNGAPPPPRALSPAEADELEWRALLRWNARLEDDGRRADAIAAYEKYITDRPGFPDAHAQLAELFVRAAHDATDDPTRVAATERAAREFQQVMDLAPASTERDAAFARVLELNGPKELNRPAQQEAAARAMIKRQPGAPTGHYALAAVLLRTGRPREADKVLRAARSTLMSTPSMRAGMAVELLKQVRAQRDLPADGARRLFTEADALVAEAEKHKGSSEDPDVLEARMNWLGVSAELFEQDPTRAAAQRELAKQLSARARELRGKSRNNPR